MRTLRIVSLVPSLTLLLADLGLQDSLVGRTKFCIHPKDLVKDIPIIGGTKQIDIQKIRILNPDLIIANKEENEKEQINQLQKEYKILVTDIKNLDDMYIVIDKIGKLTNTEHSATEIIDIIKTNFEELAKFTSTLPTLNCLYLIWRNPYMSIGKDTFIHSMLASMGMKNMFSHQTRYPIIQNLETSYFQKCDIVMLSSEPYPFTDKHIPEIRKQLPNTKILVVNGEFFSWYGSKSKDAPLYFKSLLEAIHEQNQ